MGIAGFVICPALPGIGAGVISRAAGGRETGGRSICVPLPGWGPRAMGGGAGGGAASALGSGIAGRGRGTCVWAKAASFRADSWGAVGGRTTFVGVGRGAAGGTGLRGPPVGIGTDVSPTPKR
jgi:hypothetical protein